MVFIILPGIKEDRINNALTLASLKTNKKSSKDLEFVPKCIKFSTLPKMHYG